MNPLRQRTGYLIKQARTTKGLTLKELGVQMEMSESLVSRYERGVINLSLDTLTKFAEVLGFEVQINFTLP